MGQKKRRLGSRWWRLVLVALLAGLAFQGEARATIGQAGDYLDVTDAASGTGSWNPADGDGCQSEAGCTETLSTDQTSVSLNGQFDFGSLSHDAACDPFGAATPCLVFTVKSGGSFVAPASSSNSSLLGQWNGTFDFSNVAPMGGGTVVVRVALYTNTANTVLADEEFFLIDYIDSSGGGADPVVCTTNLPQVNELGRRVTKGTSMQVRGRVHPNVGGEQITNPRLSDWLDTCGGSLPGYDDNLTSIEILRGGSVVQALARDSFGQLVLGTTAACGDPLSDDALTPTCTTAPGPVGPFDTGVWSTTITLPLDASSSFEVEATNSLGLSATEPFVVVQDSKTPTLDSGNFTVIENDLDTRHGLVEGGLLEIGSGATSHVSLLGRMTDSAPGRIAYAGYSLATGLTIANLDASQPAQFTISSERYDQIALRSPIQAGDIVHFRTDVDEPNSGQAFRIVSVAANGTGYDIELAPTSYFGKTLLTSWAHEIQVAAAGPSTAYAVTIDGVSYQVTSDATPTAAEIAQQLVNCINMPDTMCDVAQPPAPVSIRNPSTTDAVFEIVAPAGQKYTLGALQAELSSRPRGAQFNFRRTAKAPLTATVNGSGVLSGFSAQAFDSMVARLGLPTDKDSVIFAANDPLGNANQRFPITAVNVGARTITVATTSATGQPLQTGANARLYVLSEAKDDFTVQVSAGGLVDNFDPQTFDAMIARLEPEAGDWVHFDPSSPANAGERFRIISVDPLARTINIETSSEDSVALQATAAGDIWVTDAARFIIDGEDIEGGYACNPCNNESWAVDVKLASAINDIRVHVFDDAGNTTFRTASIKYNPPLETLLPPEAELRRLFFYETLTAASTDTAVNTDPGGMAPPSNACDDSTFGCAEISPATDPADRLLGRWTGVKLVGVISTDPAGPTSAPQMTLLDGAGIALDANVQAVASGQSDNLCDVVEGVADPEGHCFHWWVDLPAPIEGVDVTWAASLDSVMGNDVTIRVPGVDLRRGAGALATGHVGLRAGDLIATDRFGPHVIAADGDVTFDGSDTLITLSGVTFTGSINTLVGFANEAVGQATHTSQTQITVSGVDLINLIGLEAGDTIRTDDDLTSPAPDPTPCLSTPREVLGVQYNSGNTLITIASVSDDVWTSCTKTTNYRIARPVADGTRQVNLRFVQAVGGGELEALVGTTFTRDRTPPAISITGFLDGDSGVSFAPQVIFTDVNLDMAAPAVVVGPVTNAGSRSAWDVSADCPGGAQQFEILGVDYTGTIDPLRHYLRFFGPDGQWGPLDIESVDLVAGDTVIGIGPVRQNICITDPAQITNGRLEIVSVPAGIRVYQGTDLQSQRSRLAVELRELVTGDMSSGVDSRPIDDRSQAPVDLSCGDPNPGAACNGVPFSPYNANNTIPACEPGFFVLPSDYYGTGTTRTRDPGTFPFRILCKHRDEWSGSGNTAWAPQILGDDNDERGAYRVEVFASDIAIPPNRSGTASEPYAHHFDAIVSAEQVLINDFVLVFLNNSGSFNPLDVCPLNQQGEAQSILACFIDPALTVLSDNPTTVRGGASVLGPFFDALAMVFGSPGSIGQVGTGRAANPAVSSALQSFQQLFPSLFQEGEVDSDFATFLNLLKNGVDRGIFDEIPTVLIPAVVDPDNNPATRDGIESIQRMAEQVFELDGEAFFVDVPGAPPGSDPIQPKSSSPLIRVTPAILDIAAFDDLRGTIDVFNSLRFIDVPRINFQTGQVEFDRRPTLPLLYAIAEAIYDGFDPELLFDDKGTAAETDDVWAGPYDVDNDGVIENGEYVCAGLDAVPPSPATTTTASWRPVDSIEQCYCGAGTPCVDINSPVDPHADGRNFSRAGAKLFRDQCAPLAGTGDYPICLARSGDCSPAEGTPDYATCTGLGTPAEGAYADPNSALYEAPTIRALRTTIHDLLTSDNALGVSTLTSLTDLILCAFEPVREGAILRDAALQRFGPILAALGNQTGDRSLAECSGGGQILYSRLAGAGDVLTCRTDGTAVEPVLLPGGRGIECPDGREIIFQNPTLAPGEYCTQGELIFTRNDAISRLLPALEIITDPFVLEQINRIVVDFPDTDLILSAAVAASDLGLLNRTLVNIGKTFDYYDNGYRSSVIECGTPGAVTGTCRPPAQPVADVALNGIADLLSSPSAPLLRCSADDFAYSNPDCVNNPGSCSGTMSFPACDGPGQLVFLDAEKLPVSVVLDIVDELWVKNPPAGCEFLDSQGINTTACYNLRDFDFDPVNSLWDFLDNFVNDVLDQSERDSLVEGIPTMAVGHQNSAGTRTAVNYSRIVPGPRPTITGGMGDLISSNPGAGTVSDAEIWPPDRAFPSPMFDALGQYCNDNACEHGYNPPVLFANTTAVDQRIHGRNPFDRYLCDDFNCCNDVGDPDANCGSGSACGGAGGTVGPWNVGGTAAAANLGSCDTAGQFDQKLVNPYFGCWQDIDPGAPVVYRWNIDVFANRTTALPVTAVDCADSPDLLRSLDEANRTLIGIDTTGLASLAGVTLPIETNALLSNLAGLPDPQIFPSSNIAYKVFGIAGNVPASELIALFSVLRSARSLLANPLLGDAIKFKSDCTGFVAAETGRQVNSVVDSEAYPVDDPRHLQGRWRLVNIIEKTLALEPFIRNDVFPTLQKMLAALAGIPNQAENDPSTGLYQTQPACWEVDNVTIDAYPPSGDPNNPVPGVRQMMWGQGPVMIQLLSSIENLGYSQPSVLELFVAIEEGPDREIFDGIWEVLGDWREVTSDLDARVPPGRNGLDLVIDGLDNLVSPQDMTTVPCGNDNAPCGGTDGQGAVKGPDAEPFVYPLFPTLLRMGGVRQSFTEFEFRRCTATPSIPGCVSGTPSRGILISPDNLTTFSAVQHCGGAACTPDERPDAIYISCVGTATEGCDPENTAGALLPNSAGPSHDYSYLGHSFRIVNRVTNVNIKGAAGNDDVLVVEWNALDNPLITVDSATANRRLIDGKILTHVRTSLTLALRSVAAAIINDFEQDPDIPGVDVFDVDDVVADIIRCDTDGFFIDTVLAHLDDDTSNGDLRPLRNAIFALNEDPEVSNGLLDTVGATLGATGGGEIQYSDVQNCRGEVVDEANRICTGDAPLVNIVPIIRSGGLEDPEEQYALQRALDNLANPFNEDSNERLKPTPTATCTTNSLGVPGPDCRAFIDPILDAVTRRTVPEANAFSGGMDTKLAEMTSVDCDGDGSIDAGPCVPADLPGDAVSAFRGRLAQIYNGAGVDGIDTWTSTDPGSGNCDLGPGRPDGVVDDCDADNVPGLLTRLDDGVRDVWLPRGAAPTFAVGNWFHNDTSDPTEIVSASFFHDGSAGMPSAPASARIGYLRVWVTSTAPSTLMSNPGGDPAPACLADPFTTAGIDPNPAGATQPVYGAPCGGGEVRVVPFYFRAREGVQPVSVFPPIPVPAGQYAYVAVEQPTPGANPDHHLSVGLDQYYYDGQTPRSSVDAFLRFMPGFGEPGFVLDGATVRGVKNYPSAGAGVRSTPMVRIAAAAPIVLAQENVTFEEALAVMQRLFDSPRRATSGNPNAVRPAEPLADAVFALLLPLDISPRAPGAPDQRVPARCTGVNGNELFVFLPPLQDFDAGGNVRLQQCEYFSGGGAPEMEQGLGCAGGELDETNSEGVECWKTVRGMEPVDLDASSDYATPFELLIPILRRLTLATYVDPDYTDKIDPDIILFDAFPFYELLFSGVPALSSVEGCQLIGESAGIGDPVLEAACADGRDGTGAPVMTSLLDRILVMGKVLVEASNDPTLRDIRFFDSPFDKECDGGNPIFLSKCEAETANLFDMLSAFAEPVTLRDRVTGFEDMEPQPVLTRLLHDYIEAFFPERPEAPSLPPQELPPRISLSELSTKIRIQEGYDGSGGFTCTDEVGTPLTDCIYLLEAQVNHGQIAPVSSANDELWRMTFVTPPTNGSFTITVDGETTAQLGPSSTTKDIAFALNNLPSISGPTVSGDFANGFYIRFTSNVTAVSATHTSAGGSSSSLTLELMCDFNDSCGNPMPGAVVKVKLADEVAAGRHYALHVAAFNNGTPGNGSLFATRIWEGPDGSFYEPQAGDKLRYAILIPGNSHVRTAGINLVFNGSESCSGTHSPFNVTTVANFDQIDSTARDCLSEKNLKFANLADQQGRPAEASSVLATTGDEFIYREIPLDWFAERNERITNNLAGEDTADTAGLYLEFDSAAGQPRGRAEMYISFIDIVRADGTVVHTIYDGATQSGVPASFNYSGADKAAKDYFDIDEVATCVGLSSSCDGLVADPDGPDVDVRANSVLCPGCTVPACGNTEDLSDPLVAGVTGATGLLHCPTNTLSAAVGTDSSGELVVDPDGSLRVQSDADGLVRIPVKAGQIPIRAQIEFQVECELNRDTNFCEMQEGIGQANIVAAAEILMAGDSAPVVTGVENNYPPRPMGFEFDTRNDGSRPVYRETPIDHPEIVNNKAGEPAQDDAFFLDTIVVDQLGRPYDGATLPIDYAVLPRPALELRSRYRTTATGLTSGRNITTIATGDSSSAGPYISQAGDYLEYEIFFPNRRFDSGGGIISGTGNTAGGAGSPNAGIDIQSADPSDGSRDLRTVSIVGGANPSVGSDEFIMTNGLANPFVNRPIDQNGRAADPRAEMEAAGNESRLAGKNFYYRRIPVPEGFVISSGDAARNASTGGRVFATLWVPSGAPSVNSLATAYFRNIRISNNERVRYSIYEEGSGRDIARLTASPCNNFAVAGNCPTLPNTCQDGYGGSKFTLVFDGAGGFKISTDGRGARVLLLTKAEYEALIQKSGSPEGLRTMLMYRDGNDINGFGGRVFEICSVENDPVVVLKGSVSADFTQGAAVLLANQRTDKESCETQLTWNEGNPPGDSSGSSDGCKPDTGSSDTLINTNYDYTSLCVSSDFSTTGVSSDSGVALSPVDQCLATDFGGDPPGGDVVFGRAVGDGRFCPGAGNVGQRCANIDQMSWVDGTTTRLVQRAHKTPEPGLYRYTYTMGVSTGRQRVEVRPTADTGDPVYTALDLVTMAYTRLLSPVEFAVNGLPPPVPSKIVFADDPVGGATAREQEETNEAAARPFEPFNSVPACDTSSPSTSNCQDLTVRVLDQYGQPWTKPLPVRFEIRAPDNALRVRGTPSAAGAYLGLKLNAGIVSRPRWAYPLTAIDSSADADADTFGNNRSSVGGIYVADHVESQADGDNVLALALSNGSPSGFQPGDTVRIGYDDANAFTATITNSIVQSGVELVEFSGIHYLGQQCGLFDLALGDTQNRNQRPGFTDCSGAAVSLVGYQVFYAIPHTEGDDLPCDETKNTNNGGCAPFDGHTPGANDGNNFQATPNRWGTCVGGNFHRGPDGAWRHVFSYKSDYSSDDPNPPSQLLRQCLGNNFDPVTYSSGLDPTGARNLAVDGSIRTGKDVKPGSTRLEYGTFGSGTWPEVDPITGRSNSYNHLLNGSAERGSYRPLSTNAGGDGPEGPGDCAWSISGDPILTILFIEISLNLLSGILGSPDIDLGVGSLAWTCLVGRMGYQLHQPGSVGGTYGGHVGVDFSGYRMQAEFYTPKVSEGDVTALGIRLTDQLVTTGRVPRRTYLRDWINHYDVGRYIGGHDSSVQLGAIAFQQSAGRFASAEVSVMKSDPVGTPPSTRNSAGINNFDSVGSGFTPNAFVPRSFGLPRSALWLPRESPTRHVCNGDWTSKGFTSDDVQTAGTAAYPNTGGIEWRAGLRCDTTNGGIFNPGPGNARTRQGLWLAASAPSSTDVGKPFNFFVREVNAQTVNEKSLMVQLRIPPAGDPPVCGDLLGIEICIERLEIVQLAPVPFFFNDIFYDSEDLLPSLQVTNYNQWTSGQTGQHPGNDNANGFDPDTVDIRVAGAQVKVCEEFSGNVKAVAPLNPADVPLPAMPSGCISTRNGFSRPGGYAVARVNELSPPPAGQEGLVRSRLYFPPWTNDTVELEISAPGVAPLVYKRDIVGEAPPVGGTGGGGPNTPPVAFDPGTVVVNVTDDAFFDLAGVDLEDGPNTLTPQLVGSSPDCPSPASKGTIVNPPGAGATTPYQLQYTPSGVQTGFDCVVFRVVDSGGLASNPVTVQIYVNTAPTASMSPGSVVINEDPAPASRPNFTITGGDAEDACTELVWTIAQQPAYGALSATTGKLNGSCQAVIQYIPGENQPIDQASVVDTFSIFVVDTLGTRSDSDGGTLGDQPVSAQVTINQVNDAPVPQDPTPVSVVQGEVNSFQLTASDAENDTITYNITSGSTTTLGETVSPITGTTPATVTYDATGPNTNLTKNTGVFDTFTFEVTDGPTPKFGSALTSPPVTVQVRQLARPNPDCTGCTYDRDGDTNNDTITGTEEMPINFTLGGSDPDDLPADLVVSVAQPGNGNISPASGPVGATFTYQPFPNFCNNVDADTNLADDVTGDAVVDRETFLFTISDTDGLLPLSRSMTIDVVVDCTNDQPAALQTGFSRSGSGTPTACGSEAFTIFAGETLTIDGFCDEPAQVAGTLAMDPAAGEDGNYDHEWDLGSGFFNNCPVGGCASETNSASQAFGTALGAACTTYSIKYRCVDYGVANDGLNRLASGNTATATIGVRNRAPTATITARNDGHLIRSGPASTSGGGVRDEYLNLGINDIQGIIEDVDVWFQATAQYAHDVKTWINSPSVATGEIGVYLCDGDGSSNVEWTRYSMDGSSGPICDAAPGYGGTRTPSGDFSAMNGEAVNGTWVMHFRDDDESHDCGIFGCGESGNTQLTAWQVGLRYRSTNGQNMAIETGTTVDFTAACTDPDGNSTTASWTFQGGTPATASGTAVNDVSFAGTGAHTVTLRCTDAYGLWTESTMTVTVE